MVTGRVDSITDDRGDPGHAKEKPRGGRRTSTSCLKATTRLGVARWPVACRPDGLVLSQRKYCLDLLHDAGYSDCNPADTPMDVNHKLCAFTSDSDMLLPNPDYYCHLMKKLIYPIVTRYDISITVGIVSRFMHAPRISHLQAVERILRYLKFAPGHELVYKPSLTLSHCLSDTDYVESRKDISTIEDPFDDSPTYNIPEKPVTFVEGASYGIIILAGLGVASVAAYAVFKELIFQPKEYKIFGKALERVQNESQVKVRIGSPVTGYGQETRNRAARQRISNRVWKDEDDVEHVEVNFYIRGPHGAGKVFAEMFKDNSDKQWKFTYLIVEIVSPTHAQLMLESYVPA
ncbi:hypothetical protein KSP40_PGU013578 [Platanthera guangdongensis]|uniref:Mitochondrial import inner membrane translocase subunit Tim21 n=1 Tax=Platanthera guangdongensis TaxID=2320717 RepID=A0ABR2MGC6_9ASPA